MQVRHKSEQYMLKRRMIYTTSLVWNWYLNVNCRQRLKLVLRLSTKALLKLLIPGIVIGKALNITIYQSTYVGISLDQVI